MSYWPLDMKKKLLIGAIYFEYYIYVNTDYVKKGLNLF